MRFADVLRAALGHIRRTPVFFYANVVAITVGILLVVVMLSMSIGLRRYVDAMLTSEASAEMVEVTFDARTPGTRPLTHPVLQQLASAGNVRRVVPVVDSVFADLRVSGGSETFISLASTTGPQDPEVARNAVVAGSYVNMNTERTLIVPEGVVRELGIAPVGSAVGRVVALNVTRSGAKGLESVVLPMKIVAVARQTRHARVYAPLSLMRRIARWQSDPQLTSQAAFTGRAADQTFAYAAAFFYAPSIDAVPKLRAALEKRGYRTSSVLDSVQRYKQIMLVAGVVLTSLGLIALFTGSVSIFNAAYAAVMRRIREFAIFKTYGATQRSILSIVLTEAALTAIAAGILGFAAGAAVCLVLQRMVSAEVDRVLFPVEWWLFFAALGTSSIAALTASYFPARKAARLSTTEAMRTA